FRFLFTHSPTSHIYTLSLHDALPIYYQKRQKLRWTYFQHPFLVIYRIRIHCQEIFHRDLVSDIHSFSQTLLKLFPFFLGVKPARSEEHTSELQSRENLVCRLLLEKKK